jgi:hypothetical protein
MSLFFLECSQSRVFACSRCVCVAASADMISGPVAAVRLDAASECAAVLHDEAANMLGTIQYR